MQLLRNVLANLGNLIKLLAVKMLVQKVTFSGIHYSIPKQLRKWKSLHEDAILLESFLHKGKGRRSTWEIYWYVKNNWFTRLCGLEDYKFVRHDVNRENALAVIHKRKTG